MKIRRARITPFRLPLRRPLVTARGALVARDGFLLALEIDDDLEGWGEASPLAGFAMEGTTDCRSSLEAMARHTLGRDVREIDALLGECAALAPARPAALAAVDGALHDLNARIERVSVARWLLERGPGGPPRDAVEVNALVADEGLPELRGAVRREIARGFDTVKLKLGSLPLERDLARVRAVRDTLGDHRRLRLDANGAWPEELAVRALEQLAGQGVEYLEQPVAASDLDALARLRELALVPIAADESAPGEAGAARVIERRAADWLIVKPAAAGGLRPAWRIAAAARAAGLGVVVTSLLDSSVGVAAALQLAAALPGPLPACGLATGALFERDLAQLPPVRAGRMTLPRGSGLGVSPAAAALARCASGAVLELRA